MKPQSAYEESSDAPRLVWQTPALAGQRTELTQRQVIGRDPDQADILLEDDLVSRQHASIEVDARGRATLTDLHSTNGTFVNGEEITRRELRDGDRIGFGSKENASCAFHAAPSAAEASRADISEIDITESPTALITGELKLCPRCGRIAAAETGLCKHCGPGASGGGSAAGRSASEQSDSCTACGAGAAAGAAFCRQCGAPLAKKSAAV